MPLLQATTNTLLDQQGEDDKRKKRRYSEHSSGDHISEAQNCQKFPAMDDCLSDERKSNFSTVGASNNGFTKHNNSVASKAGTTKKLVIKNFKGDEYILSIT